MKREREVLPRSDESPEDLQRRASRILLEAGRKNKKSLVVSLTAQNAEAFSELLKEDTIFYENNPEAEQVILLDPELEGKLPPEFFENPTEWIEMEYPPIERGLTAGLPQDQTLGELLDRPYDISKVKEAHVGAMPLVIKRIEKEEVNEVQRAKEAYDAGIPTPKVLAEIKDSGNLYVFFEKISGKTLYEFRSRLHRFIPAAPDYPQGHRNQWQEWLVKNRLPSTHPYALALQPIYEECHRKIVLIMGGGILSGGVREYVYYLQKTQGRKMGLDDQLNEDDKAGLKDYYSEMTSTTFGAYADATSEWLDVPARELFFSVVDESQTIEEVRKKMRQIFESIVGDMESTDSILSAYYQTTNELHEKFREKENADNVIRIEKLRLAIEKLKELCRSKNIEHKDFEDRNILVKWDSEKDEPAEDEEGLPILYLIDWEEKSTPLSKE